MTLRLTIAAALAALAPAAWSCGHCVEDKIAAAYDHEVVARARVLHQEVAFLAFDGPMPQVRDWQRAIRNAVESVPGVVRGSVRVSLDNGSLSFAYDPARGPLSRITRTISRKLTPKGLSIGLLRTMN